jgi:threonine 3-dehydrogenase
MGFPAVNSVRRQIPMPSTTMQALRKLRPAAGMDIESVAVPAFGPSDILVRVRAASICGTDLHIYHWDRWSASRLHPPVTTGHEFCGVVEKIGANVTRVKAGDFVSAEMHLACGHCRPCRMGQPHVCMNGRIIGIDSDGAFAEFVVIPESNIWKVDPSIPEHYAAILDPLGNAVHTVLSGPVSGLTVGVTGAGPIGLMSIAVARACGATKIYAIEVKAHRRNLAQKMGADEVFDPAVGDVVEQIKEATDGAGVDVLLEMSGNPHAIHQGFQMLRNGGRASLLGIPNRPVELNLVADIIFKGATVHGIYGRRMFETWVQTTDLLKAGRLNLEPLFNERLPLDKYAEAFELLESGEAGKILFYPNGSK